jgi:TolA-binding protein
MTTDATREGTEARWEELVEAEAFGELSDAERAELEALAAQDVARQAERRVLSQIPDLVPLERELAAADRELIERAIAQHAQRRSKASRWMVAAIVLVPLAAAAAYVPFILESSEPSAEPPATTTEAPPRAATPKPARPDEAPDAVQEPPASPEPSADSPAPAAKAARPSAAELLARAQRARAARDYRGAVRAYQTLLHGHPASSEARLAQVSLAQLQLAQGNARAALAGFDAYQRRGGALAQEAHYGKIQALQALGRRDEERAEIRRFLSRYPQALQGAALKRRLGAATDVE